MSITRPHRTAPRLDTPIARANAFDSSIRRRTGRARLAVAGRGARFERIGSLIETLLGVNADTARLRGGTDDVVFDWLDSADDDGLAVVVRHDARSLCALGIAQGLPGLLAKVFGAAFCDPCFLPEIGDASSEVARLPAGADLIAKVMARGAGSFANESTWLDADLRPNDSGRARAAELCALVALEFTVLHLAQHVFGGHTTQEAAIDGCAPSVFASLPRAVDPAVCDARWQYEIHADTWAATAWARMVRRGHTVFLSAHDLEQSVIDPMRAFGLAFLVGRRIESECARVLAPHADLDHPDRWTRLCAITAVVSENLAALDPLAATEWSELTDRAIEDDLRFGEVMRVVDGPSPLGEAVVRAEAILGALRERTPRLRWAHQLVVPD